MGKKGFNENLLYVKMGRQLQDSDMDDIKVYLRNKPLSPATLAECNNFADICFQLEKKRTIVPKDLAFEFLSEMFEELEMAALKEEVEIFVKRNKVKESDSRPINLRKGVEEVRVRQRDLVENKISEMEQQFLPMPVFATSEHFKFPFSPFPPLLASFLARIRSPWETTKECHEREWNATLNDPKRVSDLQVIEWVEMAERQKSEYRELAERQIVEIKEFFDRFYEALQEKRSEAHGSSNGNVSGSQDSGTYHCEHPDSQPANC